MQSKRSFKIIKIDDYNYRNLDRFFFFLESKSF